ncbi:hypothetical protein [Streptomyces sp. B29(2018)]|uniref:hypothetical protein n=1 Tax=Streptomyces sp. B29(2018) TaxID=2485016 RepID=UPI0013E3AADA|nr:hypothetical protein [Streptomyces sp. B29(2018)]
MTLWYRASRDLRAIAHPGDPPEATAGASPGTEPMMSTWDAGTPREVVKLGVP